MMPQELIQMPADRLIVLRAGMPPTRGAKIVYWRERAFARRVLPQPTVNVHSGIARAGPFPPAITASSPMPHIPERSIAASDDDLTLDLVLPALEAAGLEPLPAQGASDDEVEAWVERFIDASVQPAISEIDHGR
jgi:type IV secretion system protein VirD4